MTDLDLTQAANNSSAWLASNEGDDQLSNSTNRKKAIALSNADYDLVADDQQNSGFLEFTGALTAVRRVNLIDGKSRRLSIKNSTSGGFDLTVGYKTGGGTVLAVAAGATRLIQGDGTNVVEADSGGSGGGGGGAAVSIYNSSPVVIGQASATGANIDFTFDETLFEKIRLDWDGLVPATDNTVLTAQLSIDGGSNFLAGTNYHDLRHWADSQGGSAISSQASNTGRSTIFLTNGMSNVAAEASTGSIFIGNLPTGLHTRVWGLQSTHANDNDEYVSLSGARLEGSTSAVNAVRLAMSSGNFSSGAFTLWGYPKMPTSGFASGQTTDATPAVIWSLPLAAGESATIEAQVTASLSTGTETYSRKIVNTFQNSAGTTTGGTTVQLAQISLGSPGAGIAVDLVANNTNDTADLQITGLASETWNWIANMTVTKV